MSKKIFFNLIAIAIIIIACPTSFSLTDELMLIKADSVNVLYEEKTSVLIGSASIKQGDTKLSGEKIIIHYDQDNQLESLFAYGDKEQQAKYDTVFQKKHSPFHATADIIRYFPKKFMATLSGDAHANDGSNDFSGPELEYWTERNEVVTQGNKKQAVSIIIKPTSL